MTVTVAPTDTVVADAFTASPVTVASVAVTVTFTESLCPLYVPVIVALPAATPVTVPDEDTVATAVSLELQMGVTAAFVPSL